MHFEKIDAFLHTIAGNKVALDVGFKRIKYEAENDYFLETFGLTDAKSTISDQAGIIRAGVVYSLGRQWDLSLGMENLKFDHVTPSELRVLSLDVVHYWD